MCVKNSFYVYTIADTSFILFLMFYFNNKILEEWDTAVYNRLYASKEMIFDYFIKVKKLYSAHQEENILF